MSCAGRCILGKPLRSMSGWTRVTSVCVMRMQPVGRWRRGSGAWRTSLHGTGCQCLCNRMCPSCGPLPLCFVTDGSWFRSHCCGGAFAVVCLDTLTWVVYPVYVTWTTLMRWKCTLPGYCVRSNTLCLPRVRWLALRHGSFTDSKSFIQALCSRRLEELGAGLVDLLLADCVRLAGQFPPPQHLYSHQQGTFLDLVLDDVDREAKAQALRQPHPVPASWLPRGIASPATCFLQKRGAEA